MSIAFDLPLERDHWMSCRLDHQRMCQLEAGLSGAKTPHPARKVQALSKACTVLGQSKRAPHLPSTSVWRRKARENSGIGFWNRNSVAARLRGFQAERCECNCEHDACADA